MNLKRDFPRIPFYDDFWKWAAWGKQLMDLHINFETVEPYPHRVLGLGDRVLGLGDRVLGLGDRVLGLGDRELGLGDRELDLGDRALGLEFENNENVNKIGGEDCEQNSELQRFDSLAGSDESDRDDISYYKNLSERGNVRIDEPNKESSGINSSKYCGGLREIPQKGIPESFVNSERFATGVGNSSIDIKTDKLSNERNIKSDLGINSNCGKIIIRTSKISEPNTLNPNHYTPKPKLKADKLEGRIIIDEETILEGIPKEVWEYKLGNRSALEWILDQYKEKTPKDPTIREKFNTYKFIDYKDKVIDLIMRVTTVSVETMRIVKEMENI